MQEKYSFTPFTIRCGQRLLTYEHPAVMGILNVTPDSFYDGGRYVSHDKAVAHAVEMVSDGADIIDIGVVSTRPGAVLLPTDEEAPRLAGVVAAVRRELPDAVISVDTCYSLPARAAVEAGADIVNDISSGAFDPDMFKTVAELHTPYVLMLNPDATPDNPAGIPPQAASGEVVESPLQTAVRTLSELESRLRLMGVSDVIIDLGFGFSKTLDQNYSLMAHLKEFRTLFPNNPLLVAISRKSMIYKLLKTTPDDAFVGTVALHAVALQAGAQMLRVHDVRAARQTIAVLEHLDKQKS